MLESTNTLYMPAIVYWHLCVMANYSTNDSINNH